MLIICCFFKIRLCFQPTHIQIIRQKMNHTPVRLFSGSRALKLDGLKTGGLSFWSRMVTVSGTLLFRPPTSSPTRNSSTRGSWNASRSNLAPWRTYITPGGRHKNNCITTFFICLSLSICWGVIMLPVFASTVKRSCLAPSRWYFTTALGPMSLSSARTGPFNTVTVLPKGRVEIEVDKKNGQSQVGIFYTKPAAPCWCSCYRLNHFFLRVGISKIWLSINDEGHC